MVPNQIGVDIVGATSLDGLSALSALKQLDRLGITGGNINDLTELKSMKFISRLVLNDVPARDLGPVGSLLHLRELTLMGLPNRPIDISPLKTLVNLEKLTILQFVIGDLFALRGMTSLRYLDLTGSPVADLSPLNEVRTLAEVSIDQRSVPGLSALTSSTLTTLHIQNSYARADSVDLTPLAGLRHLKILEIKACGTLELSPLRHLANLTELTITGTCVAWPRGSPQNRPVGVTSKPAS